MSHITPLSSCSAEQLAQLLHKRLDDRAFAFAEASDSSPPLLVNPATGNPFPINLPEQIAGYLADLHGHQAPHDTTALINIGSNDYDAFSFFNLPKTPQSIQAFVASVVGSTENATDALTQAGSRTLSCLHCPISESRRTRSWPALRPWRSPTRLT